MCKQRIKTEIQVPGQTPTLSKCLVTVAKKNLPSTGRNLKQNKTQRRLPSSLGGKGRERKDREMEKGLLEMER